MTALQWFPLLLVALPGGAPERIAHTFSIVARDPKTGEMGVAVQSHYFSVGPIVPWAEAGVGAVATQSLVLVDYGPNGLDLMQSLMLSVRESLVHGLHLIFVSSACVMGGAVVLNLLLKNVPLRTHHAPSAEPAVH